LAAKNTARFLLICIPLLLVLSLSITLLINNMKRSKELLKMSFMVPMAIPVASIVMLWKEFFHKNGMLNLLLSGLHIAPIDFMNTDKAFFVLVFTYLWKNIGYDMVLWLSGLSNIPVSYYEAAKIDGAGAWARFHYITLPGLVPTIFITAVLSVINSFKVFREAYLIAGNYPHDSIYMLQHIFNNWFMTLDIQKLCAGAVLMAVVMTIIILLLNLINLKRD
jgi:multiple sugar transport system permease protein